MNIVFVTHFPGLYGANRSLLNLIDGLNKYNVNSYVIVPKKGDLVDSLESRKTPFAIFPIKNWVRQTNKKKSLVQSYYLATENLYKNLRLLPLLARQVKTWKADIIYSNSAIIPSGIFLAKLLNIPHVWHLREFVDLDYDLQFDFGKVLFRYFLKESSAIITVSQALCNYHLGKVNLSNKYVIYNGVNSQMEFDRLYQVDKNNQSTSKPYTFVLVGRIYPKKGQEAAIRALALLSKELPNIRLLLVGKVAKSYLNYLKKLVMELNISDRVEFWGHINDPYQAYLISDAVLMCSENEAMGRVTVEAMSACLPVIGYDNAGTSELIENEHTGLLYQNGYEELALCMKRLVLNPKWARQLGENGWHIARQKYCTENYAQQVYDVLLSIKST